MHAGCRVDVEAHQDVPQKDEWVNASHLTGDNNAEQGGCILRTAFTPGEKPVFPADDHLLDLALGMIVGDGQDRRFGVPPPAPTRPRSFAGC